jgi:hypothetical protein
MKYQTKAIAIVSTIVAIATRVLAGPSPQVQEETYKRVMAKIAEKQACERYVKQSGGAR